jgi:NTE family protein
MGDRVLVDGGVVNPVPTRVVRALGADIVIGVRLSTRPPAGVIEEVAVEPAGRTPPLLRTVVRSRDLQLGLDTAADADVRVAPHFPRGIGLGLRDFSQGAQFIPAGQAAVREALPDLGAVIPWIRS